MSKFTRLLPLALLALPACSGALLEEKLKPLMQADLEPGRGLGDVVLGEATLGSFCDRYGHAGVSAIFTDERSAIELRFGMGQITFLFPVDRQFAWENSAALRSCTRDLDTAMAAHSEIRDALLTSLSVRAAKSKGSTFYQGQMSPGVRLLEPLPAMPGDRRGRLPLVAGLTPQNPEGRIVDEERGMAVFHRPKDGAEPGEPDLVYRITLFLTD